MKDGQLGLEGLDLIYNEIKIGKNHNETTKICVIVLFHRSTTTEWELKNDDPSTKGIKYPTGS